MSLSTIFPVVACKIVDWDTSVFAEKVSFYWFSRQKTVLLNVRLNCVNSLS